MPNKLPPYTFKRQDVSVQENDVIWKHPKGVFSVYGIQFQQPVFGLDDHYSLRRVIMDKPSCVVALPYDPRLDSVVIIEQIRPTKVFSGADSPCMYEFCAGLIDSGETAEIAMRRELQEECALHAQRLEMIGTYWVSPGWTTERLTMYCVEVDASKPVDACGNASECETTRVSVLPFQQLMDALDAGEIDNGGFLIGALWLARHRDRLREDWNHK
jgi:ADP-ribose pyrophosphatase